MGRGLNTGKLDVERLQRDATDRLCKMEVRTWPQRSDAQGRFVTRPRGLDPYTRTAARYAETRRISQTRHTRAWRAATNAEC